MRELLKYLKAYRKESILAPLFKMLEATFELFIPLVVQQIIDVGIGNGDTGYILRMGGFPHCPVFCGKGVGGIFHIPEKRPVCPH